MQSRPFCALNGKHARIGALLLLSGCAIAGTRDNTISRPNILFILADDVGIETLGCYGGTSYRTPHLDALASSGIRFRHAYTIGMGVMSNSPMRGDFKLWAVGWGVLCV